MSEVLIIPVSFFFKIFLFIIVLFCKDFVQLVQAQALMIWDMDCVYVWVKHDFLIR